MSRRNREHLHINLASVDEAINDSFHSVRGNNARKERLEVYKKSIKTLSDESLSSSLHPSSKSGQGFNSHEMVNIISSWKTPLHNAAAEGKCDELNLLLSYPQVDINVQTKKYNEYDGIITLDDTPLHLAAKNGQKQAVNILIKHGARCDIQNSEGATPLHLAAINGSSMEILQNLVIDKTAVSIKDNKGRTALFWAAVEGWHNLVPVLVDTGESIEETDNSGETPLIAATKNGFSQTMKILLEFGAYASSRDKLGNNALEYALLCDERTIQDEEVFDQILSGMLSSQSKDLALCHLQDLIAKYSRLKLKQSIVTLFNRIPMLKARRVIIYSKYLECDKNGFTPDQEEFQTQTITTLQMIAETKEEDFAFHPCIRTMVDKKMAKIGYFFLSIEMAYFSFFLLSMAIVFIEAVGTPYPHVYDSSNDYVRGAFEVLVSLFWVSLVLSFVLGIVTEVNRVYHKAIATSHSEDILKKETSLNRLLLRTIQSFYLDAYCYFNILWLICLFLVLPLRIIASHAQWIFAVAAVVFGSLRVIKLIRLLPGLGTYVHTITLIVYYDVPKFVLVCLMVILVLGECFFLSILAPYGNTYNNLTVQDLGEDGLFNSYYWTVLLLTRMLLQGENILEHDYLSNHLNWLSAIFYLLAMMLIVLILLNIFIAQVSDTYTTAKSKSERVVALYRLEYIVHLTLRTFGLSRKKGYIREIVLKGNEWRSIDKVSGDKFTDIVSLLSKQQSKIEQLKQSISNLKKFDQYYSNEYMQSPRSSIAHSEHLKII